mmetsp:Transcript_103365/g.267350  ORF Transcript_103365/g.267350 Transcript_103365/m.267350 type:complete len:326 (+) Transcript_103365:510-1487(+)
MFATKVSKSTGMSTSFAISSTSFSSDWPSWRWSTSRATRVISSWSKLPLPSLSKRLKVCHKISLSQYSCGPMLTAVNSAKFRLPLASRSMASKISSAAPSSSPYFFSTDRISSMVSVPSPFLSMRRKALTTTSSFSGVMSSAMTRMANFLKVLSVVLKITFWRIRIILLLLTRVLLRTIQGCRKTLSAVIRMRPDCFRRPDTTSRASGMEFHSAPNAMETSFAACPSGIGIRPVSMRYSSTPSAHMSLAAYCRKFFCSMDLLDGFANSLVITSGASNLPLPRAGRRIKLWPMSQIFTDLSSSPRGGARSTSSEVAERRPCTRPCL